MVWVTRCLEHFRYRVVKKLPRSRDPRIRRDVLLAPTTWHTRRNCQGTLRLVGAEVDVAGRR